MFAIRKKHPLAEGQEKSDRHKEMWKRDTLNERDNYKKLGCFHCVCRASGRHIDYSCFVRLVEQSLIIWCYISDAGPMPMSLVPAWCFKTQPRGWGDCKGDKRATEIVQKNSKHQSSICKDLASKSYTSKIKKKLFAHSAPIKLFSY